jgi:type IX secretion system PorP/SprF family membrane protein
MSKQIIIILTVLFSACLTENVFAQDPLFTQFYANPLYLNPALAGAARCPRICLNYRNQWPGIDGTTYTTYSASYDQHVDAINGGLGLLVTHDDAGNKGILKTTNISGMYSFLLPVSRTFSLKFAAQGTWFQKKIDWNRLTFGDMIDPSRGFVYNTNEAQKLSSKSGIDISAGVLGYSKYIFVGFAAHHLTQPDEGLLGKAALPMKITGHAGAVIPIGDKSSEVSISPNILFQQQQNFQQLNIGMYVTKGPIVGGLWYRNRDSFIILLGIQQHFFKLGYSYDITSSKLTNATAGSHEFSFALNFECKKKVKKFRTVNCPSF